MKQKRAWFEEWFDSPYYHLLYNNRNEEEASAFINALIEYLNPSSDSVFLDLACGKGRHARQINSKGYDVYGIDLSPESITYAKKHNQKSNLIFDVADMREVYLPNSFNYIFNLFTSFGYFDQLDDNKKMLQSIHTQLKEGGVLVLDYLNFGKIKDQFPCSNQVKRDHLVFYTEKKVEDGFIKKDIKFEDGGQKFHFQEKVQVINKQQMVTLIEDSGFEIKTIWGDYWLNPYDVKNSDRLIVLAQKI